MTAQSTSNNHATSREYESLVHHLIHQEMEGISGAEIIEIAHNVAIKGLSGYQHQIDVLYKFRIWMTELLVIVECKQYEKKVGVDDLLEFKSRIEDIRAHKGVFVTTSGYQSGAIEFAKANRIALLVARGTEHWAVLYSLTHVPAHEQCTDQMQDLHETYRTDISGLADRVSIDGNIDKIVVQDERVAVQMEPWELHMSMLYRKPCHFSKGDSEEVFFERDRFDRLPTNKLLKSLIIDDILEPER